MNVVDRAGRLVSVVAPDSRRRTIPAGPLPLAVVLVIRDAIILGLIAEGYSAPQVGQLLNITARTVERRMRLASQVDEGDGVPTDSCRSPLEMGSWSS